jgi:hypothetical protein
MAGYRYITLDVFTDQAFGGNPLAVFPEAAGIGDGQMQAIAREFNLSETVFILPGSDGADTDLRIFTPVRELPFAGHPTVGASLVLAREERIGATATLGVEAGMVAVVLADGGARITAPQPARTLASPAPGRARPTATRSAPPWWRSTICPKGSSVCACSPPEPGLPKTRRPAARRRPCPPICATSAGRARLSSFTRATTWAAPAGSP